MNFVKKKLTTIYNTHQPHIVLLRPPKDLWTRGGRGGEAVPASSEAFILCVVWVSYHLLMLFSIVIQERAHSSSERVLRDDDVIHTSLTLMSDLLPLPSNFLLSWLLARKKILCRLKKLNIRLQVTSSPWKGHILKFLVKITVICAQIFPLVFSWWNNKCDS